MGCADSKNIEVEDVACCICGLEDSELVFDLGKIKVVKCKKCGLIYNNPRCAKASLEQYYKSHYYPGDILCDAEKLLAVFRKNYHVWEKSISQIENSLGHVGKLLDVGSGLGYFLKVAGEHGWDVIGVEPDIVAAEFARTYFKLRIITGTLQELLIKEESQRFDVITYLQSFEHLPNPVTELKKVASLLNPGGILFLAVPNFNYLGIKVLRGNQFNIQNQTHMYHYTYSSLCHLLRKAGFKDIRRFIYWGGGRKQFGILGQTIQWLFRAAGISSEIRVIAVL